MAKRILRVGVAGQGRSGFDIHCRWLRQATRQYKIVAVADPNPRYLAQARQELGCRTYKTYEQLIADDGLDLFVNALPSTLHVQGSAEALNAGHNVVCEKPLATKVKDFDRVVAASRKAGRLFAPFQNSRFYPFFGKMRDVIDSGVLGRILHIRICWCNFARRWDWQTLQSMSGGSLNNTGPHPMDHAVMLFGPGKPKVFCRMQSEAGSLGDADDFCAVTLYGKGSPTVEVLLSSYMAYPPQDRYVVSGTLGTMAGGFDGLRWQHFDPARAPRQVLQRGWAKNRRFCGEKLPWIKKTWRPRPSKLDSFNANSKAFYDNIYGVLTGTDDLVVTPAQVRRQIAVLEQCHRQNHLPTGAKRRKR